MSFEFLKEQKEETITHIDVLVQRQKIMATRLAKIASDIDPKIAIIRVEKRENSVHENVHIKSSQMEDQFDGSEYKGDYYAQSYLTGDAYCWERLSKLLIDSTNAAEYYSTINTIFVIFVNILGAGGTVLATYNMTVWVPLAVAVITTLNVYISEQDITHKADKYRTISRSLSEVKTNWLALPREARKTQACIDQMVAESERVIALALPSNPSAGASDEKKGKQP